MVPDAPGAGAGGVEPDENNGHRGCELEVAGTPDWAQAVLAARVPQSAIAAIGDFMDDPPLLVGSSVAGTDSFARKLVSCSALPRESRGPVRGALTLKMVQPGKIRSEL